jgi:hypothetical protein
MKQTLELFNQPEAEWLGEAYVPFTPENIMMMVMRINLDGELTDYDSLRMFDRRSTRFQWIDVGMVTFIPYERCKIVNGLHSMTFEIDEIEIAAPVLVTPEIPKGEECFVVRLIR